jgi:hypothetical protein
MLVERKRERSGNEQRILVVWFAAEYSGENLC